MSCGLVIANLLSLVHRVVEEMLFLQYVCHRIDVAVIEFGAYCEQTERKCVQGWPSGGPRYMGGILRFGPEKVYCV
jgi:hypothetical protein